LTEYDVDESEYAFGWTDLNLIRHAELVNNLSSLMLTHLDVLNDVDKIKMATKYTIDDDEYFSQRLPAKIDDWGSMVPQYTEMPGWNSDVSVCDDFKELPTEAKSFVRKLEQMTKKEVQFVSVNNSKNDGLLRIIR
jgi:adenylosuccinate synthase